MSALLTKEPTRSSCRPCSRCAPLWTAPRTTCSRSTRHPCPTPTTGEGQVRPAAGRPGPVDAAVVIGYPACRDCSAPVKFRSRDRCHACHAWAIRPAAEKRTCPACGQLRHLTPIGICAGCVKAATPPRPAKTVACRQCGQHRRNAGHGLCGRCVQADPDRPFRYAAAAAARMTAVPAWWEEFTAFAAARHHPGGAVSILRETIRLLTAEPAASPQQKLLQTVDAPTGTASARAARTLTAFFTSHGLALPDDAEQRRAAASRQRYLDAIPQPLQAAGHRIRQRPDR